MGLRLLLVGLIATATAAFVIGVSLERGDEAAHHDRAAAVTPAHEGGEQGEAGEGTQGEAESGETATGEDAAHEELRPLGIDVEAWPFVAIASAASLALALGAWLRPRVASVLAVVALAMLLFAAFDVREVVHQLDIDESGLAALAAIVAALHLAAVAVAAAMMPRAWGPGTGRSRGATTMPA